MRTTVRTSALGAVVLALAGCGSFGDLSSRGSGSGSTSGNREGSGRWVQVIEDRETLEFVEWCSQKFEANYTGTGRIGYAVQGGSVNVYLLPLDDYNAAKKAGAEWSDVSVLQKYKDSPGGDFSFSVTRGGRYAVVFSNAASMQAQGEDKTVTLHYTVSVIEGSSQGSGTNIQYGSTLGWQCPSCLSATCHRVHPMCSQCNGMGRTWSHIQNANIKCNRCYGTGRY